MSKLREIVSLVDPYTLLKDATRAVPAVKYALAVAGILAAAAIATKLWGNDWFAALVAAIATIILMVVMVVFARLSTTASINFRGPIFVLTWFSVLLLMV